MVNMEGGDIVKNLSEGKIESSLIKRKQQLVVEREWGFDKIMYKTEV